MTPEGKAVTMNAEHVYKPAWRSFYSHITAMIACFVLVVLIAVKVPLEPVYTKVLWGLWALFTLVALGDMLFKRLSIALIVRADEVALEKGILKRESIEIGMRSIRTVQVTQRIIQRLLNIGDISIASSGTDNYEIHIANMPSPHDIRNQIQSRERAGDNGQPEAEKKKSEAQA